MLPGRALFPDAFVHGGPRRLHALHSHTCQLDRERRRPPAHVPPAGNLAGADSHAPAVEFDLFLPLRQEVLLRLPEAAARTSGSGHLQGLTPVGQVSFPITAPFIKPLILTTESTRSGRDFVVIGRPKYLLLPIFMATFMSGLTVPKHRNYG